MAQTTVDYFADRGFTNEAIYRTDMDRCEPAEALGEDPQHRRWRAMAFATDDLAGTMLLAGPNTAAPTVRYPLDMQGWHAVSIGVLPSRPGESDGHAVRVRLSDDAVESMLNSASATSNRVHDKAIVEMFWKVADLTGQDLHIGQVAWQEAPGDGIGAVRCMHARIAYVKLVPLTEAEVEATRADRADARNRTLFAHQDAHGPHWLWRMTTADEVRRELEPYRDTDFSRMYWECGQGDLMYNLTNIGRRCTFDGLDDFDRVGDRLHAESWRSFAAQGIDPLRVALDYCHEIGMEFHASWRVAGFHFPPPHDHFDHGDGIYKRHPEWRGEDRNGVRTPRMAYSFPEVRAYAVDLLREVAQHPIDGVCLLYNRRPPLVEYERPIVEGFTRTHGGFPRLLPPDDPTWLKYRAQTLTQFMREVREAMDEEAEKQGRSSRIQVSAIVGATEQENLQIAIDLRAWVDEGLVDTLIPYSSELGMDSSLEAWTDPEAARWLLDLTEGTPCTVAPNIMPRHLSPAEFRRRADGLYGTGAPHLFFWDCAGPAGRANYQDMWSSLRRLGHREEIAAWRAAGEAELVTPTRKLNLLGDWDLSYQTPG
ncbi:MAG: family 10 glycosylhydrolase [Chloroflexi bacterium]|nr:family 10 glycosylhydrolase [Chloroflexota bacterium]